MAIAGARARAADLCSMRCVRVYACVRARDQFAVFEVMSVVVEPRFQVVVDWAGT